MHTKRVARTKRAVFAALAFAAAVIPIIPVAAPAGELGTEVLANSDIVALSRAGMAPQVIAAKITSSSNIFDVSSRGLLFLKENGVADDVIASMLAAGSGSGSGFGSGFGGALQPAGVLAGALAGAGTLDPASLRRELENLASPGTESRASAQAWLLANRAAALPELRRALTDREPAVRAAAVTALGDLRDGESLHAIRNLIVAPDPAVRRAAAQALYALGDSQSVNAAEQALSRGVSPMDGYIRLVGHAKLTRAAGGLGQILSSSPDNLSRSAAAWSLGEIGRAATAARPALERAIEADADADVRRESAGAIAKFHDSASAAVLMNACRRDPEVRTVALAGLAEYPESVEFLVGVMNLGADQIAANELETARASLYRLTGQDFGLDGGRWGSWFAANRGAFAGAGGGAAAMGLPTGLPAIGPPAGGFSAGSPLPLYSAGMGQGSTSAPAANVDVEAWSLVADADDIPMAPQVDAGSPAVASSLTSFAPRSSTAGRPAAPPGAVDSSSIPMALSPNDFDAGAGFALPGLTPPSTQSIPAMDIAQGALTGAPSLPIPPMEAQQSLLGIGSATDSPAAVADAPAGASLQSGGLFRTWSSDPDRGAPEPRAEDEAPSRTFAGFPGRSDAAAAPDAGAAADAQTPPPLDAPAAADAGSQWRRVPAEELSGGLADDGAGDPFAAAATGDAFATDPFASPVDPFAAAPADPFASADSTASSIASSPSPFGDSAPALLPSGPVITPMAATEDADADPLRGFSLSLPGMGSAAAGAAGAAGAAAGTVTDAAQSFADNAAFADDGGIIVDDSGNVFPMPEDNFIPAYDPAAQSGETVLFGGADLGGLDAAGLGAAEASASDPFAFPADPFAAPDGLSTAQSGETVIFTPTTPDPTPIPVPTDVFGELPALEDIARESADAFTQSVIDGAAQGADAFSQSVDGMVQDADAFVQDAAGSVDGFTQSVDAFSQSVGDSVSSAAGSVNSSLFVEPEPGQVMVDENWTGADAAAFPAPQAASAAPVVDFPDPAIAADSAPIDSAPVEAAVTYTNPYENNPPPPNPAFITTDPNFTPPIRDYTEPYRPPAAAPMTPVPAGDSAAPPAEPAPAGRSGGNAKAAAPAPASGEMPRMLGEGFFGK